MKKVKTEKKAPHEQPGCHCVHIDNQFESIIDLIQESKRETLEAVGALAAKFKKLEDKMAQNMQDVKDAVTSLSSGFEDLKTSVEALVAQGNTGGEQDTTEIVSALNTIAQGFTSLKDAVDGVINPPAPTEVAPQ